MLGRAVTAQARIGDCSHPAAAAAVLRGVAMGGEPMDFAAVNGVTPLMAACYGGHLEAVRRLLDAGARTDLRDRVHKPAMVYAAGQGHTAVVRLLLDRGVAIDAAYENQLTALMWAAGQGQVETIRLLLDRSARTDLRDDRGMSAPEIAQQAGQHAVVSRFDRR